MKSQWPTVETQITIGKVLVVMLLLIYFIHAPLEFFHQVLQLLHVIYECFAFVVEEILHHSLHLSKFECQLIVFYSSWCLGLLSAYYFGRRLPDMIQAIKSDISTRYFNLKNHTIQLWTASSWPGKIRLLLIQLGLLMGTLVIVLT
ncbi:MAG: hypothetical protein Q7U57_10795 [Methylovulum sp.]|nr:hypothetical protein [Methylovulum sp.]